MKQLTRFELAAVKRTAANIGGLVKKRAKLVAQIEELAEKAKAITAEIEIWDAPIVSKWGKSSLEIIASEGVVEDTDTVASESQEETTVESTEGPVIE